MNDKELLELAAKAAGIEGSMRPDGIKISSGRYWNPLTDDGDALRLAVKLNFVVDVDRELAFVFAGDAKVACEEPSGTDQHAATRRAIVRAAAEIGRMK